MKPILACLVVLALAGCTTFNVRQTDGAPGQRQTTTELRATAWFSSTQSLAKLRAFQSEKTQSFGATNLEQQGATNTAAVLESIVKILELLRPTPL